MDNYFFSIESVIRERVGISGGWDVFALWMAVMELRDEENQ